jgi:hypothetical protein
MWLVLVACVHPTDPAAPPPQPRVPTPQSAMYVHVARRPTDSVVARAWPGQVDESLSGAAGAVAFRLLRSGTTDAADVRWRAVLAGYPWPVERAEVALVGADELPAELLATAAGFADRDVGLVRARESAGDQWVLLVGARRGELPAFPREPAPGTRLLFPGYDVVATAPAGDLRREREALFVDTPGEWLVTLADAAGEVTTFPLYVGRATPQAPPFGGPSAAEDAGDLAEELLNRLDDLDRWYQRDAADRDPALDAVARARLREFVARRPLPPAPGQLAAAGYFGATAGECQAPTVAACLDAMWWSQSGHAALAAEWATVGMATVPTSTGVALSITVAQGIPPAY